MEMVAPPFEHRLAAARSTKQEDALLTRNVDLHFIHRKGASLACRVDRRDDLDIAIAEPGNLRFQAKNLIFPPPGADLTSCGSTAPTCARCLSASAGSAY
jgi:hypothetical protein